MTKVKVAALAVVTLLLILGGVVALSGRADAPLIEATGAEETVLSTVPETTVSTINFGDVQTFLTTWMEAENAMAFEAFETERIRLEAEEAERQRISEEQAQAEAAAVAASTPAPTPTSPPTPVYSGGGGCVIPSYICQRESGFNYGALNASSGAGGMYQFMPSTWNGIANQIAPEWVGTPPHLAPPGVQDQFASYLWAGGAGCSHWSAC